MKKRKVKISRVILIVVILAALIGLIFVGLNYKKQYDQEYNSLVVNFKEKSASVELNAEVDTKDLVQDYVTANIEYPVIDTKTLGEKKIVFKLISKNNISKEVEYIVSIVDKTAPEFKMNSPIVVLKSGDTFDPKTNVDAKALDQGDGEVEIKIETTEIQKGSDYGVYQVIYTATDSSNNENKKRAIFLQNCDPNTLKQPIYVDGLLIANKIFPLPKSYAPGRDAEANSQLTKMLDAAKAAGYNIPIKSAFRSYETQVGLFQHWVNELGEAQARRESAVAGYSEHQTGLSYDIGKIDESFENTGSFTWLSEHAHEYGFIMRYPKGKEEITGYIYEPWHYRYIGRDMAIKVKESGKTLEEYLGLY
ncbi:MAG: M15 family metallopeptidase [Erysipelotrichaceae bacterium]